MEEKTQIDLNPEIEKYISDFQKLTKEQKGLSEENDKSVGSALIYEKIRNTLEYQDEHLIFKNAIARIFRRRYLLGITATPQDLASDLVTELSWSNYLNPELIKPEEMIQITQAVERYVAILKNARSGYLRKNDLVKMITNWFACEIDEIFHPTDQQELTINFVSQSLAQNLSVSDLKISDDDALLQLKIVSFSLILKPDYHTLEYWVLRKTYPDWTTLPLDELKKIARSFDPHYNKVAKVLNHPLHRDFFQFAKRNIAPYILLHGVITSEKIDIAKISEKPASLQNKTMQLYETAVREVRQKVWRGTYRALIFILLTKISLAFIVEIPFDHYFAGEINYLTLFINILTPPLLMLVAGTFVKSPPKSNEKTVSDSIALLLSTGTVLEKKTPLLRKRTTSIGNFYNILYSVFSLAILVGTIKLLVLLEFNFVSIILFFFFVSAVSFFSFRIRTMALELAMKRSKDDALTSTLEFLFLPFIRIGKFLSDQLATFNPFILALDFIIEAPLKSIIKIVNSWLKFVNSKKEDLEY